VYRLHWTIVSVKWTKEKQVFQSKKWINKKIRVKVEPSSKNYSTKGNKLGSTLLLNWLKTKDTLKILFSDDY